MTTNEPNWVPATSQSEASFGIWTVTRHKTGLVSIACRGQETKDVLRCVQVLEMLQQEDRQRNYSTRFQHENELRSY